MKEEMNSDRRLESALQQDAAIISKLSPEVPESLRSRIARTPAVPATASGNATTVTSSFFSTKSMILSISGLIAVGAMYFAFKSDTVTSSSPLSPLPSSTVISLDTPRKADTIRGRIVPAEVSKNSSDKKEIGITQSDVDRMMRGMPEPESTIKSTDSIHGKVSTKR